MCGMLWKTVSQQVEVGRVDYLAVNKGLGDEV